MELKTPEIEESREKEASTLKVAADWVESAPPPEVKALLSY